MRRPAFLPAALLALAALAAFLAGLATAGTQENPEFTDPSGDWLVTASGVPTDPQDPPEQVDGLALQRVDLQRGWVAENATHLFLNVLVGAGGTAEDASTAASTFHYAVHFTVGSSSYEPGATRSVTGTTPTAPATAAAFAGNVLNLTLPKSAIAGARVGTVLSGLHAESSLDIVNAQVPIHASDVAPDAGEDAGISYTLGKGQGSSGTGTQTGTGTGTGTGTQTSTGTTGTGTGTGTQTSTGTTACTFREFETDRTDTDKDCLPDHWEREHFNNLGQGANGDPDNDGCSNACEYANGTDPNVADTDGDGSKDGDEVRGGTNPHDAESRPGGSDATGDDPLEKIKADVGYLGLSSAAAGAVILVSLIALLGRWK